MSTTPIRWPGASKNDKRARTRRGGRRRSDRRGLRLLSAPDGAIGDCPRTRPVRSRLFAWQLRIRLPQPRVADGRPWRPLGNTQDAAFAEFAAEGQMPARPGDVAVVLAICAEVQPARPALVRTRHSGSPSFVARSL